MKIQATITALALILFPYIALAETTSTSYELDPAENTVSSHHVTTGSTYIVEGSIESIVGKSSNTYSVESGSAFQWYCGDGFIDPDESCEGANLNSATCSSLGYASGTLSCLSTCTFDTTSCVAASSGGGGGGGGGGVLPTSTTTPEVDEMFAGSTGSGGTFVPYYTYGDTITLSGTMSVNNTIEVNGTSDGVTYPSSTTWSAEVTLSAGDNIFAIVAKSASGATSSTSEITIRRRALGDLNDDSAIDDYDLSLLIQLWGTTDKSGDFNGDGEVDDYDFSVLVSRWT